MRIIVVLLACIVLSQAQQYVPITQYYDGFTIGNASAPFKLEAFYDLVCPDSNYSNSVLNNVFEQINFPEQNQISFTYHIFPLPYHNSAYYFAQLFRFILDNYGRNMAYSYVNLAFNNQQQFFNPATFNLTRTQVFQNITNLVATNLGLNRNQIYNSLFNSTCDWEARESWKYGVSRGVSGTPIFFANGVLIDGAESFNQTQWIQFLQQYTNITVSEQIDNANDEEINQLFENEIKNLKVKIGEFIN